MKILSLGAILISCVIGYAISSIQVSHQHQLDKKDKEIIELSKKMMRLNVKIDELEHRYSVIRELYEAEINSGIKSAHFDEIFHADEDASISIEN